MKEQRLFWQEALLRVEFPVKTLIFIKILYVSIQLE